MELQLEKKYQLKNVGETYTTKQGYTLTVIGGGSKRHYCTVQIKDWITETSIGNVRGLSVKYPYHPTILGVGMLGVGPVTATSHRKLYTTWTNMLLRAYDIKYHEKQPTYRDVTVCDEWKNLQNFAEWYLLNYIDGYELDKDILGGGTSKVYSPETCLFIPNRLNTFMATKYSTNTSGYVGVTKKGSKWTARTNDTKTGGRIYIGYFDTPEEAYEAYKIERRIQAEVWRKLMSGVLPENVIRQIN